MATAFRPGRSGEAPEDILGRSCAPVRLCGQDAAIAAIAVALYPVRSPGAADAADAAEGDDGRRVTG
ncbi:hypothetical protein [Actinomadura terrae]|uniref:hypothetical protein n=1 Tax=Actinomadura terrae TaxID=604353 RepID=UPI001FA6F242|nr:hypothetical protein [Actinomadura terrae]